MPRSTTSTGTQAVDRAASVVAAVVEADAPLSPSEVADSCDLARSTAGRLLSALERNRLVERAADGSGYVAGPLFWLYAARHDPWEEVVRMSRPAMERVAEVTAETVHLGVARNGRVAHVAQVDTSFMLGSSDWSELEVPDHASALGKVLIAYGALPEPEQPLEPLTEHCVTEPQAFAAQLRLVSDRGFAVAVDELEIGLTAAAAPVRGLDGDVFGALGVSGPTARLEHRLGEVADLLITEAGELSERFRRRLRKEGVA